MVGTSVLYFTRVLHTKKIYDDMSVPEIQKSPANVQYEGRWERELALGPGGDCKKPSVWSRRRRWRPLCIPSSMPLISVRQGRARSVSWSFLALDSVPCCRTSPFCAAREPVCCHTGRKLAAHAQHQVGRVAMYSFPFQCAVTKHPTSSRRQRGVK